MSELVVCGLNYHDIPVAIRERFTIPESCLKHALEGLKHFPHVKEAVLLSTCNRTEVYAVVSNVAAGWREIDAFFDSVQTIAHHGALKPNFRLLREDVALHLFRVAAGLDSMVLGEGQIMSQVKTAHQEALQAGTAGPIMDSLFSFALNCGKRVRTETSMARKAVSISSAAVELGKSLLGSYNRQTVLVLGAGKMGQICLKLLLSDGKARVIAANRTRERIESFKQNKIRNIENLEILEDFELRHKAAAEADLVIIASAAPQYLLRADLLQEARAEQKILNVIDISVPRNADPAIAELLDAHYFDSDHIGNIVKENRAERHSLVAEAESIVFEVLREFQEWQRTLFVVPTIAELREKIESIRVEHVERVCNARSVPESEEAHNELEEISRAIVNQILHHPTTQLKATNDYDILRQQAEALRTLFNLSPQLSGTVERPKHKRKSTLVKQ
jgi:glutamyl-tRNA reductase